MSQTYDFYSARADEAAAEANATQLVQVRERALRSEAAWRAMAARVLRTEATRAAADVARQERRDAELLAAGPAMPLPQT